MFYLLFLSAICIVIGNLNLTVFRWTQLFQSNATLLDFTLAGELKVVIKSDDELRMLRITILNVKEKHQLYSNSCF
ncbi:unnamed protein product [Paramecium octaurelia]|uniref:Uncharacterized protein n=1 Tax=Paramecium octaurelia TaxID=43137 RepID=A0A8S1Y6I4_PAROT|nr:unnamed protein product [Paramecium octaurelia]